MFFALTACFLASVSATAEDRLLWASQTYKLLSTGNVGYGNGFATEMENCDLPLLTWRMLPDDDENTCFDLYRTNEATGEKVKLNDEPIYATNYRDLTAPLGNPLTYTLTRSGSAEEIGTFKMLQSQSENRLPYTTIDLKDYDDLGLGGFYFKSPADTTQIDSFRYLVGDGTVGDLDGDGKPEIVVKRQMNYSHQSIPGSIDVMRHTMLLEAYKTDGTFMWRICMGPNTLYGNIFSIVCGDFNGDGRDEVALHTSEGVIFGDGKEIGDTNGDGITDYRNYTDTYLHMEPEFLSIVDGLTGAEIARTDYIPIKNSEEYGDGYFKRAHSQRIFLGNFGGENPSVGIIRGCYAKIAIETFDLIGDSLALRWHFDTDPDSLADYRAQGNHNLRNGDVDGDGLDEIVYGAIGIDHDGTPMYTTKLGHGDALHMGKFSKDKEGLQVWSCFESGNTNAAYRDAATGEVFWKDMADEEGDCGRCMIADVDPNNPGYEMWIYRGNAHSDDGTDLGYSGLASNSAVWWGPYLNRALHTGTTVDAWSMSRDGIWRMFTIYRYAVDCATNTKDNTVVTGDFLGDWREEMVFPNIEHTQLWIFSTWFATDYRFPYLRSDHTYELSLQNENVGYNQPTHLGYYFASDMELSAANLSTAIKEVKTSDNETIQGIYSISGQKMGTEDNIPAGIYITKGKKVVMK